MAYSAWRREHRGYSFGAVISLAGILLLSSCAAAPFLIPVAIEFARNLIQTSLSNYGSKHRDNLSNLVNRLSSPYVQNLPPVAGSGPGMPAMQGFPQQAYPGPQTSPAQQAYPGQQMYPGQTGAHNPYGTGGAAYPGSGAYPGTAQGQYGTASGYPAQPGNASSNPYGNATYPSGQTSPYGTQDPYANTGSAGYPPQSSTTAPYGGSNPYGGTSSYPSQSPAQPSPYGGSNQPYGAQNSYGSTGYPPQTAQANPYGTAQPYGGAPAQMPQTYDPNNPYGSPAHAPQTAQTNPYGTTQPYGGAPAQMPQTYDPNNPYGSPAHAPQTAQTNPYGTAQPYGGVPAQMPQAYDPNNPYGSQTHAPQTAQANPYGTAQPYGGAPAQMPQAYDPNNPYGSQTHPPQTTQTNPYGSAGAGQGYGQSQSAYGQPQAGYGQQQSAYGTSAPYGTQQQQQAYGGGGYGTTGQPYGGQYGAPGAYPRGLSAEPVAVDVAMIRQKQTAKGKAVVLMNDGEVLKDGGSKKEAGDKFKIVARANCDCYLYIVAIDGSGWAEQVYPPKGKQAANPVKKDQEYAFPEGPYWFTLDQVKGIETFYVVASANRRADLEDSMVQLAAETRPAATIVAKVEEPPVIPRGVGSVKPRGIITVKDESGTAAQVTPLSYAANLSGQDVTVTRWFKHE